MEEYEVGRMLAKLSYHHWITKELFSVQWFIILGVILSIYAVWLKYLDKSRVKDLLLFGSLSSVGFLIADIILGSYFGFTSHKVDLFPFKPSIFIVSITITPVLFMLVYQYCSSWRNYTIWLVICTAVLSYGLAPLYIKLGILEYHKGWNHSISFLRTFADGMIARAMLMALTSLEQKNSVSHRTNHNFYRLHPATAKPLDAEPEKKDTQLGIWRRYKKK